MGCYWRKNAAFLVLTLLLGICASLLTAGVSLLLQAVVDAAVSQQAEGFGRLFVFAVLYVVILCAAHFFSSLSAKYLTVRMIRQYRQDLFRGIMSRRPARYFAESTSDYISVLTNDMKLVEENYILALLDTVQLVIMFAATLAILLFLSPVVTGILMATLLLMLILPSVIGRVLEKRQDSVSRQMAEFTGQAKDLLSGYEVLKSYNRMENAIDRFREKNDMEIRVRFHAARLFALNEGLSDTLSVLSTIAVIFTAAYLVLTGDITTGTLLALVQLSGTFIAPVVLLMQNIPKVRSMKTVIARLNQYKQSETLQKGFGEEPSFEEAIELKNVSFSYDGKRQVLNNLELSMEHGKKYAILGQSGCGKSTLIKLILGYFDDYEGEISYDGRELRSVDPDRLASLFSVIHQNIYVFNESIRDNIMLHEKFSRHQLEEAAEKSGVGMFVRTGGHGMEDIAGENGTALSGGQKQRIALARAFIRCAPCVVLDEGTAALDRKTAREIENRLLQDPNITLLTVTHHPEPEQLALYDEIYYMEGGRLEKRI